jgi:hypothetical protein
VSGVRVDLRPGDDAGRGSPEARRVSSLSEASTGDRIVTYWLKITGTVEVAVPNDWWVPRHDWQPRYADASMFGLRPRVRTGDRLVNYAAGSPGRFGNGRFYSVEEVISDPELGPNDRWPWQVKTKGIVEGPLLENCPTLADIGVEARSVRRHSHIRLSSEQGRRAEGLLRGRSKDPHLRSALGTDR